MHLLFEVNGEQKYTLHFIKLTKLLEADAGMIIICVLLLVLKVRSAFFKEQKSHLSLSNLCQKCLGQIMWLHCSCLKNMERLIITFVTHNLLATEIFIILLLLTGNNYIYCAEFINLQRRNIDQNTAFTALNL